MDIEDVIGWMVLGWIAFVCLTNVTCDWCVRKLIYREAIERRLP